MSSDEPGEDADALDDDELLEAYLGIDSRTPAATQEIADWPPLRQHDVGLSIDAATLAWFKSNHADWRNQMRFVLKAWVIAQQAAPPR